MKKILFTLLLLPVLVKAQTVTVKIGSDKYVTINGQNYPRGYLLSQYTYKTPDSLIAIIYANTRTQLIPPTARGKYRFGDSSDAVPVSTPQLRTWMNANFENK
jgi:hypothetical protein